MRLLSKKQIVDTFKEMGHRHYNEFYPIAYNVKMHHIDPDMIPDDFDLLIEHLYQDQLDIINDLYYIEYNQELRFEPQVTLFGRSGGWLVIESFSGINLRNMDYNDLCESFHFAELWDLYKLHKLIEKHVNNMVDFFNAYLEG